MQLEAPDLQFADTTVRNYINELKTNYEHQIHKLEKKTIELENKYLDMKEQRDLLLYKKYSSSAETVHEDEKQPLLFAAEAEPDLVLEEKEAEERTEVKSYTRKKAGRKPIDPSIRREERIVDIEESEKVCACGAKLTRIGEETAA